MRGGVKLRRRGRRLDRVEVGEVVVVDGAFREPRPEGPEVALHLLLVERGELVRRLAEVGEKLGVVSGRRFFLRSALRGRRCRRRSIA